MKSMLIFGALLIAGTTLAHEGHDHGEAAPAPPPIAGTAPQRLADGGIFVPKPVQRTWALRTAVAEAGEFGGAVELSGRVVFDPALGGRVQAAQPSRVDAPARGLPRLGQKVVRGEVLAVLVHVEDPVEKARQQVMVHEARNLLDVALRRQRRHQDAPGYFPRREVEETRIEIASLEKRIADLQASIAGRETVTAPVSGVIAAANVQAGQVVDAREVLFEIVDPQRLMVEAQAYDPRLTESLGAATGATPDGQALRLAFVGGGRSLRDQSLPLLFRIEKPVPPLALGQTVTLVATTKTQARGVAIPAGAVMRGAGDGRGETRVWLHVSAERFVPRVVVVRPLGGDRVLVTEGLAGGERVVTAGAALLAQVR